MEQLPKFNTENGDLSHLQTLIHRCCLGDIFALADFNFARKKFLLVAIWKSREIALLTKKYNLGNRFLYYLPIFFKKGYSY